MPIPESRQKMVRDQILRRGVRSRSVLKALLRVDRRAFLPPELSGAAYTDAPLNIGLGQTLSQPYMAAVMLDLLEIRRGVRVLEVGAGSGYVLALLQVMGAEPYGIERLAPLADAIPSHLDAARLSPVKVLTGDGSLGWPEEAPFDRILVSAACPRLPPPLLDQLAENGLLIAPVGGLGTQILERARKAPGGLQIERFEACIFVPMRGAFGF